MLYLRTAALAVILLVVLAACDLFSPSPSPQATTMLTLAPTVTTTPSATATSDLHLMPTIVQDAWAAARAALPASIPIYKPTNLPTRFGSPALLEAQSAAYTIMYEAPDERIAFILGNGWGAYGNAPGPPDTLEPLTVHGMNGTLLISAEAKFMMVSWLEQGRAYQIKAYSARVTQEELRQIVDSLVPVPPVAPPLPRPTVTLSPDTRSLAIANIRACLNAPDASVQYLSTAPSAYAANILADFYHAGDYAVQVNHATAQIIQIGPSTSAPGLNQGSRLSVEELKALALEFIARCAGPDTSGLVANGGTRGANAFFRWEDGSRTLDGMHPFVEVDLNAVGQLLSYAETIHLEARANSTPPPAPATPVANTPAPAALDRIAYVQADGLWVKDLPDGMSRRIASGTISQPRWSPTGQWLTYLDGQQRWIARASGQDARQLPYSATWLPTRDTLVYSTDDSTWLVNADGSGERKLADVGGAMLSPDGHWLAYTLLKTEPGQPANRAYCGLWLAHSDGADARELFNMGTPPSGGIIVARWSPDNRSIWFWTSDGFSVLADGAPLHAISVEGGQPYMLTQAMLLDRDFMAISPDGRSLVVTEGAGREVWTEKQLTLIDLTNNSRTPLTDNLSAAILPTWSPDGQYIAHVSMPDIGHVGGGPPAKAGLAQRRIWLTNRNGSHQYPLTNDARYRDEWPHWSADGQQIVFVRLDASDQASLWVIPSAGGEPRVIVEKLAPLNPETTWFGYYGLINWGDYAALK